MSELQIPVKQQDDGVHGHGYNQGIDDCMPLIKQLQTKLAESEARVGRLESAIYIHEKFRAIGDLAGITRAVVEMGCRLHETKSQSLQHIQADGIDLAADDIEIMSSPKSAKFWQDSAVKHLRFKANKLRKQQTNGSDGG